MTNRIHHIGLLVALSVTCGPEPGTTDSGSSGTTTTSSSTSTGAPPTTGSSTSEATSTSTSTSGDSSSSTTDEGRPCGCAEDEVCVQLFDGLCTLYGQSCEPNPDACEPGYPCAPACQPLCGGDSQNACNNSDCPGEIAGAVHCFGI